MTQPSGAVVFVLWCGSRAREMVPCRVFFTLDLGHRRATEAVSGTTRAPVCSRCHMRAAGLLVSYVVGLLVSYVTRLLVSYATGLLYR